MEGEETQVMTIKPMEEHFRTEIALVKKQGGTPSAWKEGEKEGKFSFGIKSPFFYFVSQYQHQNFKKLVPNSHDSFLVIGGCDKNDKVFMLLRHDIPRTKFKKGSFFLLTI